MYSSVDDSSKVSVGCHALRSLPFFFEYEAYLLHFEAETDLSVFLTHSLTMHPFSTFLSLEEGAGICELMNM